MSKITDRLKTRKLNRPLWDGPYEGVITFSLLEKFLFCRERFRLLVVEGLKPIEEFNHKIEYGNMWHECEQAWTEGRSWEDALVKYAGELSGKYPEMTDKIRHWLRVCSAQFPVYVEWWSKHKDMKSVKSLFAEKEFKVQYMLNDKRIVNMAGKFDRVDEVTKGQNKGLWLQENKTKGDVREELIERQLTFDLQTGFYVVALNLEAIEDRQAVKGVRYNVVRRPLSGGKYGIVRLKPTKKNPQGESADEYYERLRGLIEGDPQHFFMRHNVPYEAEDTFKFETQTLNNVLIQLCDWWDWVSSPKGLKSPFANPIHWRHPYGVTNPLDWGSTHYDVMLDSGSLGSLQRVERLHSELEVVV